MTQGQPKRRRSEVASSVAFAAAFLILVAGLALLVIGLAFDTRATIPGLGLVLLIVGLALSYEFGVKPARRNQRQVLKSLGTGLAMMGRWCKRMAGVGKR